MSAGINRLLKKIGGPRSRAIRKLSEDCGCDLATVYNWLKGKGMSRSSVVGLIEYGASLGTRLTPSDFFDNWPDRKP